jgi:hypothetical protein
MKISKTLVLMAAATFSLNIMATEIKSCTKAELVTLNDSIQDHKTDGFVFSRLIVNKNHETVGFYSWNKEETDMYAEVCEYLGNEEDLTVSSEWFYWDSDNKSSNPASFKAKKTYRLSQDEGIADIKVLTASRAGFPKISLEIIGWGEMGQRTVRKSTLTLE